MEKQEKKTRNFMENLVNTADMINASTGTVSSLSRKNIFASVLDELSHDTQRLEIKVNSADFEFASASLPEIVKEKNLEAKVIISQDENIEKGSCIVVANNGVIDANFKTQLAVLQNTFGIYKGGL